MWWNYLPTSVSNWAKCQSQMIILQDSRFLSHCSSRPLATIYKNLKLNPVSPYPTWKKNVHFRIYNVLSDSWRIILTLISLVIWQNKPYNVQYSIFIGCIHLEHSNNLIILTMMFLIGFLNICDTKSKLSEGNGLYNWSYSPAYPKWCCQHFLGEL